MKRFFNFLASPYITLLIILVLFPTMMILSNAFFVDGKLSIESIGNIFDGSRYLDPMINSFWMAMQVTLLTILISVPICLAIWKINSKYKLIIILLISMPMWINLVARTRAIRLLFDSIGFLSPEYQVVVALALIYLPFMIISVNNQLDKLSFTYVEASRDLGANDVRTFLKVIGPLILPGILTGINLVLLPAATSVVVPVLINPEVPSIGKVFEDMALHDPAIAAALSFILLLIMISFIIIIEKMSVRNNLDK